MAEKFQAMVALGMANSRMKDFYDLWYLARTFDFEGATLAAAIAATFGRRKTALPATVPTALSPEFYGDPAKRVQWRAFVKRSRLTGEGIELPEITPLIAAFVLPVVAGLLADQHFSGRWHAASASWIPLEA
ncbi:MAG: hypothetical protein K0Q72_2448 [Armatimonadetes bacterium]|nr:hypothetical protein [Armatimonadota bacterium]